jgi:hypothetical protein
MMIEAAILRNIKLPRTVNIAQCNRDLFTHANPSGLCARNPPMLSFLPEVIRTGEFP